MTAASCVGVSLDGPAHIHDARRVYANGAGSFSRVMAGIAELRRHQVEFNILTVVHDGNVNKAGELMEFYREQGFGYLYDECLCRSGRKFKVCCEKLL